jgi:hypothetical protein
MLGDSSSVDAKLRLNFRAGLRPIKIGGKVSGLAIIRRIIKLDGSESGHL